MKRILPLAALFAYFSLFFSSLTGAQNATIKGKVVEIQNGKEVGVAFANVSVPGTSYGATTDFDGMFSFNLPAGNYEVSATFVGFLPQKQSISVAANETQTLNFTLKADVKTLQTTVVQAERIRNTEKAVIAEIRQAQQIVSGIGSEQIKKSQDRDAAEIIKRVPGVTIMEDRYVNIRGLAERYNMVWLNNTTSPSVEPDIKAFSFDMVPSSLIDRLLIYKTPAPELPGEFAGGVIKIFTKTIPENNGLNVSLAGGYRIGTTFNDFLVNKSGNTEWMGFDDGGRKLPDNYPTNLAALQNDPEGSQVLTELGRSLKNNWTTVAQNASPDLRASIEFIRRFNVGERVKVGHITAINYSNTRLSYLSQRTDYNAYDTTSKRSDTIFNYFDNTNIHQVRAGLLHNWSLSVGPNHKFEFKNIFNQIGNNTVTVREGRNIEEGELRREYSFRYFNRSIYIGQLSGTHKLFNDNTQVDWTLAYSASNRKDPDWRRIRTAKDLNGDPQEPYRTYIPFTATPFFLGRLYFDLTENIKTGTVNIDQKITISEKFTPHLKAGLYLESKNRSFAVRNLGYAAASNLTYQNYALYALPLDSLFMNENINSTNGLRITEDTKGTDSYTASNNLLAYYAALEIPIGKRLNLSGGLRMEHNRQQLQSSDLLGKPLNIDLPIISVLPSANLSVNLTEKMLIRFAYGNTVNRPEFRELAPFAFYDFNFNSVIYGNDSLLTPTIQNIDARWELYPALGEMINVGVFFKRFTNPIETYFVPGTGSGGTRNFTFRNATSAYSYGAEVELRKSLSFISDKAFWQSIGLVANAAYIFSQIDLGDNSAGQDQRRPLQGQSPYIINSGLYVQLDSLGFSASILYNVIGPRIRIVGTFGTPDIYEMPRNSLDLSLTKFLLKKRLEVKLAIQNIINQPFLLIQDANLDKKLDRNSDQLQQSFRTGQYITAGLVYRF